MNRRVLCFGLLAAPVLTIGRHSQGETGPASAPDRSPPSGEVPNLQPIGLHDDPRFAVKVKMEAGVSPARQLIETLREQVRVKLLATNAWQEIQVGVAADEIPAADLMDALARLFRGQWIYLDYWVLAPSRQAALGLAAREEQRKIRVGEMSDIEVAFGRTLHQFVRALTPAQWGVLEAGERLTPRDMTPLQWGFLRESVAVGARHPYIPPSELPRRDAFEGQVQIWMDKTSSESGWTKVAVAWASQERSRDGLPATSVTVERTQSGSWVPISGDRMMANIARATQPLPGRQNANAPPLPDTPPDYRQDERFKVTLQGSEAAVTGEAVVRLLAEQVKAPVLMQGIWLKKPIRGATHRMAAWQLLEMLEKHSGGKWEPVGPVSVLVPPQKPARPAAQKAGGK